MGTRGILFPSHHPYTVTRVIQPTGLDSLRVVTGESYRVTHDPVTPSLIHWTGYRNVQGVSEVNMANRNWSWQPPKLPPRAKLDEDRAIMVKGSPRSEVPHVESKTEAVQVGGWGRGPGNNVSNVMNGVNAIQADMAVHMDRTFGEVFKARRKERQRNGRKRVETLVFQGPTPASKLVAEVDTMLRKTGLHVALSPWQEHALSRLKTKR